MKKIFKISIILGLLSFFTIYSAYSYSTTVSNNIANSVLRLHVIANSDSVEDQNLKYKVRDNIINYMNEISLNAVSKEEAINIAKQHTNDFYNIAKQTILDNGYTYDVKISIGNFYFPTKSYGDIDFPAGFYDALRIEIGNASGQNWWCVLFPPLCFVDISSGIVPEDSKQQLDSSLSDEEYAILSSSHTSNSINLKFKLLELFSK